MNINIKLNYIYYVNTIKRGGNSMRRTKSVFLCALLATLAFMPAKDNTVFAKEKVGVTVDVVEEKNNLFNEEIIWEPGSLEESSIKISNNLSKDIVIKTLIFS